MQQTQGLDQPAFVFPTIGLLIISIMLAASANLLIGIGAYRGGSS